MASSSTASIVTTMAMGMFHAEIVARYLWAFLHLGSHPILKEIAGVASAPFTSFLFRVCRCLVGPKRQGLLATRCTCVPPIAVFGIISPCLRGLDTSFEWPMAMMPSRPFITLLCFARRVASRLARLIWAFRVGTDGPKRLTFFDTFLSACALEALASDSTCTFPPELPVAATAGSNSSLFFVRFWVLLSLLLDALASDISLLIMRETCARCFGVCGEPTSIGTRLRSCTNWQRRSASKAGRW